MINVIMGRIYLMIPTLLGITFLSFLLGHVASADPAVVVLTMDGVSTPSAAEIMQKRIELGLDKPLLVQYGVWVWKVLQGDLGASYITNNPVASSLWDASKVTLQLSTFSLLLLLCNSVLWGTIVALRKYTWIDRLCVFCAVVCTSMPVFWIAIMGIDIFAERFHLFPSSGSSTIWHFILPSIILSIPSWGVCVRIYRDSLLQIIEEPYIMLGLAKGFPKWYVVYYHGVRNALSALMSLMGNYAIAILGGSAIIEIVFSIPGLGSLVYDAIRSRDYPMIQGYVLFVGSLSIIINIAIDFLYIWINPSLRFNKNV